MNNNIFTCRLPILEACMNGCSTLSLALAVESSGAFPSYWFHKHKINEAVHDIEQYKKITGHNHIVIGGISIYDLKNPKILQIILDLEPSHIELTTSDYLGNLLTFDELSTTKDFLKILDLVRKKIKVLVRLYAPTTSLCVSSIDGFCVKGKESGGKTGDWSVEQLFKQQKQISPDVHLIPYGGIGSPAQVKFYQDLGASIVGVGTLFASSIESPIHEATKLAMVNASSQDLTQFVDTKQNALVLGQATSVSHEYTTWNRYDSLKNGINTGIGGHIYAGTSIDYVTKIRSVKEIVQYLTQDINIDATPGSSDVGFQNDA